MIKIVLDALGGDKSPEVNVEGAITALEKMPDLELFITGKEEELNKLLEGKTYDKERLHLVNATEEITCNDVPTTAIKTKKDSSLVVGIDMLKQNEDINAIVSIGSTGAVLSGAVLKLGRVKGVKRPALCPVLPTVKGGVVAICDSGANAECDSFQLTQFAVMASLYMQKVYNIEKPRVALLNIGAEEEKGDLLRKETYQILKERKDINFVGNMEGRDLLSGEVDVVVCDGFSGNVLLKSTEGACLEILGLFKKGLTKNIVTKMGALLIKGEINKIKNLMDYNHHGGAVLLGTAKTVVKGHGSSKAESVFHCIEQAYNMEKSNIRADIEKAFRVE